MSHRTLAIETSGQTGSVALSENGTVLVEETFPHGLRHAAGLVPMLDRLLRARRWTPKDIARIDVSVGPGSFTGLRIGITLAKTLALTTGAKLVAVPSMRVLAENAPSDAKEVMVVLDARRGQAFIARFGRAKVGWEEIEAAHLGRVDEELRKVSEPVFVLGEGIPAHRAMIEVGPNVVIGDELTWRARASVVAQIGQTMAQAGDFADPDRLVPLYLRKPEAQEKYELQQASTRDATP